jgi:hypothetical protein
MHHDIGFRRISSSASLRQQRRVAKYLDLGSRPSDGLALRCTPTSRPGVVSSLANRLQRITGAQFAQRSKVAAVVVRLFVGPRCRAPDHLAFSLRVESNFSPPMPSILSLMSRSIRVILKFRAVAFID